MYATIKENVWTDYKWRSIDNLLDIADSNDRIIIRKHIANDSKRLPLIIDKAPVIIAVVIIFDTKYAEQTI